MIRGPGFIISATYLLSELGATFFPLSGPVFLLLLLNEEAGSNNL